MDHATGNVVIYILGISVGLMLSRYLYIGVKRKPIVKTSNNILVTILNIVVVIVGFVVGFITVVIIYTVLYLITNGGKF